MLAWVLAFVLQWKGDGAWLVRSVFRHWASPIYLRHIIKILFRLRIQQDNLIFLAKYGFQSNTCFYSIVIIWLKTCCSNQLDWPVGSEVGRCRHVCLHALITSYRSRDLRHSPEIWSGWWARVIFTWSRPHSSWYTIRPYSS